MKYASLHNYILEKFNKIIFKFNKIYDIVSWEEY